MYAKYGMFIVLIGTTIISAFFGSSISARPITENSKQWQIHSFVDSVGPVEVVIFLEPNETRKELPYSVNSRSLSRGERIRTVSRLLHQQASNVSTSVEQLLSNKSTSKFIKHWIVPAYTATLTPDAIDEVLAIDGVRSVVPNVNLIAIDPVDVSPALSPSLTASVSSQLQMLDVQQVWDMGISGKGRLVASFDTGVDVLHPALSPKWRGNTASLSSSWFSTISPTSPPSDKSGHGTHTMGIMVGSEAGDTVGVAPGAEWITAAVIDQGKSLSSTISDIIQAFQWALDPDGNPSTTDDVPDVILNSWGIPNGLFQPCDATFWQVIDNVEAAGIVTLFAAGNEGPSPKSIRNPADRATDPLNSFAVGAVDNSKNVASFSSRGPATCDTTQKKPEVVAPGVGIRSTARDGGYVLMSGTSMAAPFVAGLVLLAREFNPDATVEQIKWALIRSVEDIGPIGEDNSSGYGLVNAARMITELQKLSSKPYRVLSASFLGDGIARINQVSSLEVQISNLSGQGAGLVGRLIPVDTSSVSVVSETASFIYLQGSAVATSSVPYQIIIDSSVMNGTTVAFVLELADPFGNILDSIQFQVIAGFQAPGTIGEHTSGSIRMSVSDFGQYGFSSGSIYNVGGEGVKLDQSGNVLYESGIMLSVGGDRLANAVRTSSGEFSPSDFVPQDSLSELWSDLSGGNHRLATFTDGNQSNPIPITIKQQSVDFADVPDDRNLILQYYLVNNSTETLAQTRFSLLFDFDLAFPNSEQLEYDAARNMIYQFSDSSLYVGVVGIVNIENFTRLENGATKAGLTRSQKISIMSANITNVSSGLSIDPYFIISTNELSIGAFDSVEIALAVVVGKTESELFLNADQVSLEYSRAMSQNGYLSILPDDFELFQNYPNPFNPTTTISFALGSSSEVTLDIFNILGQRVSRLVNGNFPAGQHFVQWDARNENGDKVSSGVYLYRVQTNMGNKSRKMILLR